MEYVILGLLQLHPMTGYDIRSFIKTNLSMICSDSAGSVQTALKKLVGEGFISFSTLQEKGKNKKIFSVTPLGQEHFLAWVQRPMEPERAKNMELSKLFFLGIAPKDARTEALRQYIRRLEQLHVLLAGLEQEFLLARQQYLATPEGAPLGDVLEYQGDAIRYGMDALAFEKQWYEQLLKNKEENNEHTGY